MEYSTLYFDLTNGDDLAKIESNSINDILLSQDSGDTTGSTSPFYIILKMNGLFRKRKPESFNVLNKFQETPYPLKFITLFVDDSPKDERPTVVLSQEIQKPNLRILWVPDSKGLEIDGQAIPRAIGSWDRDPEGRLALNEFIEILKIPEVFHDCIENTTDQKVYIPGYKKLRVGFGDEKDNYDVFFKAINSITGNVNPANLPAIIFNKPSETIIGSDLQGSDFIEEKGLLSENIEEIIKTQRKLLYLFGITKEKNTSAYKNMLKRAQLPLHKYDEELNEIADYLTGKIDELAEKLSSVEALSGLNNEDINKLLEIGINITNKSSEFETQQDAIVESSWREILQNLKNGYSFEALIPNLENEIENLTPKNNDEIVEKVKEVKNAAIFRNISDVKNHMPKLLSSLLGGLWTKLLVTRNFILASLVITGLVFANIQVGAARDKCTEALGYDLSEYSNLEFLQQFVLDQDEGNLTAQICRSALPTAEADLYFDYDELSQYRELLEQKKSDFNNGLISVNEYNQFVNEHNDAVRSYNQKVQNANRLLYGTLSLLIPLIVYVLLTVLSIFILFYTNVQIRSWGNNLGLKQLENVTKKLKQNIENIVLNDIKFGQLRNNLKERLLLYKKLIDDIQEFVESSQDTFLNLQVELDGLEDKSSELVNPKYVQKVTPISQVQSQGMFERVVSISRNEIIEILSSSSNNNLSKLFGRTPEQFSQKVSEEFQNNLKQYISSIKIKGILEIDNLSNSESNKEKESLRAEIWKSDSIIKEPLEKIVEATKNDLTMQMISSDNIELLDRQNTDWRFIKFLPKTTVDWFSFLNSDSKKSEITITEFSETAGFMRLIPINRNNMDVIQ
jgi:hypothetical protein